MVAERLWQSPAHTRRLCTQGRHHLRLGGAVGHESVVERDEGPLRGLFVHNAARVIDDQGEEPQIGGVSSGRLDADLEHGADQPPR